MGIPPVVTAAGQVTATSLLMLPMVLLVDRPWQLAPPSPAAWAAILSLALLCTALAYVVYFRILAVAGATNLATGDLPDPGQRRAAGRRWSWASAWSRASSPA